MGFKYDPSKKNRKNRKTEEKVVKTPEAGDNTEEHETVEPKTFAEQAKEVDMKEKTPTVEVKPEEITEETKEVPEVKDGDDESNETPTPEVKVEKTYSAVMKDFINRKIDGMANPGRVNAILIAVHNCFNYGLDKELTREFISYVRKSDDKDIIADVNVATVPERTIGLIQDIVRILRHPEADEMAEFTKMKAHKEFLALVK